MTKIFCLTDEFIFCIELDSNGLIIPKFTINLEKEKTVITK